ncbi:DDE-type integrase/transposase/recombinase [Pontibacillus yanchengensis]|uniref:DDE-type integrase/transposase/recombinase n=1 Tax=Pontibacillus yanchengensis TaxID=462910 RepID=A0A6I5A480_9BACI|nr:Mu transposase C-terminal domain-containing protein [Pontibacillus yanchengensis]MYL34959.1 DDE-type integrase/transposase/recombinase [Pontibacillus yanchengensis]
MDSIFINSIIEWLDQDQNRITIERVLWISPELNNVIVIKIDKGQDLPFSRSYSEILYALNTLKARKLKVDPNNMLMEVNKEYIEIHKDKRDKAWSVIKDIVTIEPNIYLRDERGELIRECIKNHGVTKKYLYKMLKRYWVGGKVKNALMPNYWKSGGKGQAKNLSNKKIGRPSNLSKENPELKGVNVLESDKKIFHLAIKTIYEQSPEVGLKYTYDEMIKKYYNEGYHFTKNGLESPILPKSEDVPSYRQFLYWYDNEFNSMERYIKKEGNRKYNLNVKPNVGEANKRVSGPGAVFEIDATIADVYLVSSLARNRIIGRPVVYIVKDVFSRLVTGLYVGLEGPSWVGAMLAIENTSRDKKEYCNSLNIEIDSEDWPCKNLPTFFAADRGEMEGCNADNLTDSLGIQILNTPPYRADLKGIVERHFKTLNTNIRNWMPGAVHKDFKERGGRDYRLDAKLSLKAFERIIILSILEHNQKIISHYPKTGDMIKHNVETSPVALWEWGIKYKYGFLKEYDNDTIRLTLMPKGKGSITREGVYFNRKYYSSEFAIQNNWFEDATINGRKKIDITYDPRSLNLIYVPVAGKYVAFQMLNNLKIDGETEPRIEDFQEYYYSNSINEEQVKQEKKQFSVDTESFIKEIVKEETTKTNELNTSSQSKSSKLKAIKQNRHDEKNIERSDNSWQDTVRDKSTSSKEEKMQKISNNEEEENDGENHLLSILKSQSDKRRSSR